MKLEKLKIANLKRGDIVQNKASGHSYVITSVYTVYAIAVTTIHISNPDEWLLVNKND